MSIFVHWASQLPAFNTVGENITPDIAMDSLGNVYVAYDTTGEASGQTTTGAHDIVVFKLDTNGVTQWVQQQSTFNTTLNDSNPAITIDQWDNIYVAYQTAGTAPGQTHVGTGTDIVVFKMDSLYGDILWVTQQPTFNTSAADNKPGICTDLSGYIYVAFYTFGKTAGQTQTAYTDIAVFKMDPAMGKCLWVAQQPTFNANLPNTIASICTDTSGNIYGCYQTIGRASGQVISGGFADIVVFKLEPTKGQCIWVAQQPTFNTQGYDQHPHIVVDTSDNIYVCYYTTGTASGQTNMGSNDIVVFKLEPTAGQCVWVRQHRCFNTSEEDLIPCLALNLSGYVYVCYYTAGVTSGQINSGEHDIVFFKLEPTQGDCLWVNQLPSFNSVGDDTLPRMVIDPAGDMFVTYQTTGTPSGQTISKMGETDVVVYKLSPPQPSIKFVSTTYVFGDSPPKVGSSLIFTYTVTNNGGLPLDNIVINDNLGTVLLPVPNMEPGDTQTVRSAGYALTNQDFANSPIYVQTTVDGTFFDTVATDYTELKIPLVQEAKLTVIKQTTSADNYIGGEIHYAFTIKNIGNVPFNTLRLDDDTIGLHLRRTLLEIGATWFDDTGYMPITPEIYKQYYDIKNTATVTAHYNKNGKDNTYEVTVDNYTTLCLTKDSMILLSDGSSKPIQEIHRGDVVSTGHQVARLCEIPLNPTVKTELIEIRTNSLGNNLPDRDLRLTGNHPIVFAHARRPAKCFTTITGVSTIITDGIDCLYDLQFDHDGTYIANGIEVQSCSPRSVVNPLPKELYYDQSHYSEELVWDAYEQELQLITGQLKPRVVQKNHKRSTHQQRHNQYKITH
jgi:uncharacterized repeat protein (TIGR01451 family)